MIYVSPLNANYKTPRVNFCASTVGAAKVLNGASQSLVKSISDIPVENIIAYVKINKPQAVKFLYNNFGYQAKEGSVAISCYKGERNIKAGLSMPKDFGNRWLEADMYTPLSSSMPLSCSLLYLVNNNTERHFMFHVFNGTKAESITRVVKEKFPNFDKIQVLPGSYRETIYTTKEIIEGIQGVIPNAEIQFSHVQVSEPEIFGCFGELSYARQRKKMSFKILDNFVE